MKFLLHMSRHLASVWALHIPGPAGPAGPGRNSGGKVPTRGTVVDSVVDSVVDVVPADTSEFSVLRIFYIE